MLKVILGLSFVFSSAFAGTAKTLELPSQWMKLSEVVDEAKTTEAFVTLQKSYPEYLGEYDANLVISAFIIINTWQYVGYTSCAFNDSRLVQETAGVGICLNDEHGSCFSKSTELSSEDPCGN